MPMSPYKEDFSLARILVVDDDGDILKLAKAVLAHENHEVFVASDAMQAMDILNHQSLDLLVSDANMPHYSGFELVQTLKRDPQFVDLPVAMLTGLRERKDIEKAIKVGVDDYIVKPIDPMIFIQKIDLILRKNPPKEHPKIHLDPDAENSYGKVQVDMQILSISEVEIQIETGANYPLGKTLELSCAFFSKDLGEEPPLMKVSHKDSLENHQWRYTLTYLGARESYLQKVRKWIFTHGSSTRKVS
ncbi:MAG: hypothetical protein CL676_10405 [Bdellovibrionaceae bacterium]|nr:hypothetical protein [Pseudobdellovibrionaceae bacterium]|tara:strand:- start:1699 stop:2436 length:738 start_codon:yes stop_codon:yes gene_type:complete